MIEETLLNRRENLPPTAIDIAYNRCRTRRQRNFNEREFCEIEDPRVSRVSRISRELFGFFAPPFLSLKSFSLDSFGVVKGTARPVNFSLSHFVHYALRIAR
jgi:hypothetical protein